MRFCCALEDDHATLFNFASRAFDAYFSDKKNLDDVAVLIDVANACGLDGADLARRTQQDDVKERLRVNTQEVIDRGGFGSPTMFVNRDDIYFGNDQLPILRLALA